MERNPNNWFIRKGLTQKPHKITKVHIDKIINVDFLTNYECHYEQIEKIYASLVQKLVLLSESS
ncbi:MAG: hypothetical protein K0R54_1040 [Clostridiaceae bacterium]|jgi:hypothetical protein|nr:hypothetical protein [Clostridiaceae bacterium]